MPSDLQALITAAPSATTLTDGILLMVQGGEKRQAPTSLFQPYDSGLAAIAALTTTTFGRSLLTQADASAARTTLGLVTTTGGNGTADVGKVPLLTANGGLVLGKDDIADGNIITVRTAYGYGISVGVYGNGQGIYSEVNDSFSQCYHAHVTSFSTGSQTAFDADLTGGSGVNWGLGVLLNPTHYAAYLRENISGTAHDRFTINAQGGLTWYANGTTLTSGTDKTTLTPATPSGTHTVTIPAISGTLVTTGDTGSVTSTMLAGSIALSKLSITGTPDGTKFLRDDGSWQVPAGGGGGLTVGTTTIASGTSGRWLYNNGGVLGEIALGTGVATWLQTPTLANLNSAVSDADLAQLGANTFTGVQTFPGGSVSAPAITSTTAGSTTGIYFSTTNTIDFAINGVRRIYIDLNGTINTNGSSVQVNSGNLLATNTYLRQDGVTLRFGASDDVAIGRDGAAETLALGRRNTSANCLRIYNTYTSSTNLERLSIDWRTTANTCLIMTEKGSGGGTARELHLGTDALASIKLDTSGGIDFARLSTTTETITPDKTITLKIAGTSVKIPCL